MIECTTYSSSLRAYLPSASLSSSIRSYRELSRRIWCVSTRILQLWDNSTFRGLISRTPNWATLNRMTKALAPQQVSNHLNQKDQSQVDFEKTLAFNRSIGCVWVTMSSERQGSLWFSQWSLEWASSTRLCHSYSYWSQTSGCRQEHMKESISTSYSWLCQLWQAA